MLSIAEAVTRLAPLMNDLSGLAAVDALERVFDRWEPAARARNLIVRLIHDGRLRLLDGEGKAIGVQVTTEARAFFQLYVPKPGRFGRDHNGYDNYDEASTYLDEQEFGWLLDFLGPEPTLFLDWQLAYRWADMAMPSAREWGFRQRDPDDFPPCVQQRLAWVRRFNSGRKSEPDPPSSLPSGRFPLFADRWFGDLSLYSIEQFSAFFGRDGFPCVANSLNKTVPSFHSSNETGIESRDSMAKPVPELANSNTSWTEDRVKELLRKGGKKIKNPHKDLPRMVALLQYLDEVGIRENAPDKTRATHLAELQKRHPDLRFTVSTLESVWKPLHTIGLISSKNRMRSKRGNWD